MKKRLERLRSNPWIVLHVLGAVFLYGITIYLTATMLGSQGSGIMKSILTLLGVGFEITNVSITIEAVKRRKFSLWFLACLFMVVSFIGAALGMMTSFKNATELAALDPVEVSRANLLETIAETKTSLELEQKRLSTGSALYRTDGENTRESILRLEAELKALRAELSGLPPPKRNEASGGYFASVPFTDERSRYAAELLFRIFIAALLQVGGCVTIVFTVQGLETAKAVAKKAPAATLVSSREGLVHLASKTERLGIYKTSCGRLTRSIESEPGHRMCPECLKLTKESFDETSVASA